MIALLKINKKQNTEHSMFNTIIKSFSAEHVLR